MLCVAKYKMVECSHLIMEVKLSILLCYCQWNLKYLFGSELFCECFILFLNPTSNFTIKKDFHLVTF